MALPEPIGLTPEDPAWDRCGWLTDLRDIPDEARWPRLMSAPHPMAVGSYGPEVAQWAETALGMYLRWWQRLALARILEHGPDGGLLWLTWLLSTPRQVGKSWLLRALLLWRIHQAERFGEPQLVLHTGKDLNVCHEVQRPARAWARAHGYKVREANGQQEIESPEGSRWMIRGRDSLYGYSASLAAVDEAWKVAPEVVEDGMEPTMAERQDPQLGLISTAHRAATSLMPDRRAAALANLHAPTDVLLIEWSATEEEGLGDLAAWRMASPYWSERRARLVTAAHVRAITAGVSEDPDEPDPREAFRSQWLNVWPKAPPMAPSADEALLADGAWAARRDLAALAGGPLLLGLEDYFGQGAATGAAGQLADGRVLVWGRLHQRRPEAAQWLAALAEAHPGSRLVLGAAMPTQEVATVAADVIPATAPHLRQGLALLRELVASGRLIHDGGPDLAEQVSRARVREGPLGLVLHTGQGRMDLLHAVAWTLTELLRPEEPPPAFRIR